MDINIVITFLRFRNIPTIPRKNITLDKPILHMARENLFYDWLKSKNKVGGQNKIPRLSNDRSFFEELIKMN